MCLSFPKIKKGVADRFQNINDIILLHVSQLCQSLLLKGKYTIFLSMIYCVIYLLIYSLSNPVTLLILSL